MTRRGRNRAQLDVELSIKMGQLDFVNYFMNFLMMKDLRLAKRRSCVVNVYVDVTSMDIKVLVIVR